MTLIEVTILAALFPMLIFTAMNLVRSGQQLDQQVREKAVMMEKLRTTLRRIADELRTSSRTAEDLNADGILQSNEDRNGNGRLESDWLVGTNSISFNRMLPDGSFDLPITYRIDGDDLVRDHHATIATTRTSVIARNVSQLMVSTPTDETVTVLMTVEIDQPGGGIDSESMSITIQQRN